MCAPGYGNHIGKAVDGVLAFGVAGFVVAAAALLWAATRGHG